MNILTLITAVYNELILEHQKCHNLQLLLRRLKFNSSIKNIEVFFVMHEMKYRMKKLLFEKI